MKCGNSLLIYFIVKAQLGPGTGGSCL
jgi:hypothetical protein